MYDFIDIAANKQLSKLWEVIPHHLAVSPSHSHHHISSSQSLSYACSVYSLCPNLLMCTIF